MQYKLVIQGRIAAMNEFIFASNRNRHAGNKIKQDNEEIVTGYIVQQLRRVKIVKPVRIDYYWYEPNKKRDLDNVSSFGRKCIQDALVKFGVLHNDGWKQIVGFSDSFFHDKENPRIEIIITEIQEGECLC